MEAAQEDGTSLHDRRNAVFRRRPGFLVGEIIVSRWSVISAEGYGSDYGFIGFTTTSSLRGSQPRAMAGRYGKRWRVFEAHHRSGRRRRATRTTIVDRALNWRTQCRYHTPARSQAGISAPAIGARTGAINASCQCCRWTTTGVSSRPGQFPARVGGLPDAVALAAVGDNGLLGYGALRPCRQVESARCLLTPIADAIFSAHAATHVRPTRSTWT